MLFIHPCLLPKATVSKKVKSWLWERGLAYEIIEKFANIFSVLADKLIESEILVKIVFLYKINSATVFSRK